MRVVAENTRIKDIVLKSFLLYFLFNMLILSLDSGEFFVCLLFLGMGCIFISSLIKDIKTNKNAIMVDDFSGKIELVNDNITINASDIETVYNLDVGSGMLVIETNKRKYTYYNIKNPSKAADDLRMVVLRHKGI